MHKLHKRLLVWVRVAGGDAGAAVDAAAAAHPYGGNGSTLAQQTPAVSTGQRQVAHVSAWLRSQLVMGPAAGKDSLAGPGVDTTANMPAAAAERTTRAASCWAMPQEAPALWLHSVMG